MAGSGSSPNPEKDQPSASPSQPEERKQTPHILIVEDNASDVFLIRTAIKTADLQANIHVLRDGEQAIQYFEDMDRDQMLPCPSLVILDINLPRRQGGEVLEQIRKSGRSRGSVVLVVSTSDSKDDQARMIRLGANGYFHKPSEYNEFMKLGKVIKELLGI